ASSASSATRPTQAPSYMPREQPPHPDHSTNYRTHSQEHSYSHTAHSNRHPDATHRQSLSGKLKLSHKLTRRTVVWGLTGAATAIIVGGGFAWIESSKRSNISSNAT